MKNPKNVLSKIVNPPFAGTRFLICLFFHWTFCPKQQMLKNIHSLKRLLFKIKPHDEKSVEWMVNNIKIISFISLVLKSWGSGLVSLFWQTFLRSNSLNVSLSPGLYFHFLQVFLLILKY